MVIDAPNWMFDDLILWVSFNKQFGDWVWKELASSAATVQTITQLHKFRHILLVA